MSNSRQPTNKLVSIQYLRGVAAMGVVLTHASGSLFNGTRSVIPFEIGAAGVDLFFIISGFIMFYTTAGDDLSPGGFYLRRCIRIVPLYFILTTFSFALARAAPQAFNTISAVPYDYVRSVLFIPFDNSKLGLIQPVLAQGWTLNYEIFFYLVFGICLLFTPGVRIALSVFIFLVLSTIGHFGAPSNAILRTYTDSLILEFVFGMLLGYALTTRPRLLPVLVCAAFVATAAILFHYVTQPNVPLARFIVAGVPAFAVVATALWLDHGGRVANAPLLLLLGNASYSIYLTHAYALGAMRRIWPMFFDSNRISTNAAFMAVALVVTSAVGIAIFKILENPLTQALNRRLRSWRSRQPMSRFSGNKIGSE